MSGDGKVADTKYFPVRWNEEDWKRIEDGIKLLEAETHVDVSPTDFIRTAVRRLHETLATAAELPAKAI